MKSGRGQKTQNVREDPRGEHAKEGKEKVVGNCPLGRRRYSGGLRKRKGGQNMAKGWSPVTRRKDKPSLGLWREGKKGGDTRTRPYVVRGKKNDHNTGRKEKRWAKRVEGTFVPNNAQSLGGKGGKSGEK